MTAGRLAKTFCESTRLCGILCEKRFVKGLFANSLRGPELMYMYSWSGYIEVVFCERSFFIMEGYIHAFL